MQEELESLLALQEKDRAVMEAEAALEALQPELNQLDEELHAVEETLAQAKRRVEEVSERRETLEGKIESYRVMQDRRRQKLEWVRGAKEASTLMAEIDLARGVLAREEAEWMRSADEVDGAAAVVLEIEARVAEVREQQAPRRGEIDALQQECRHRLEQARAERQATSDGIKREWLSRYERVRRGRAPLALYPLHGGACGYCFTAVPLHLRQQLQQNEGAAACEACGVLVYIDHP